METMTQRQREQGKEATTNPSPISPTDFLESIICTKDTEPFCLCPDCRAAINAYSTESPKHSLNDESQQLSKI